MKPRIGLALALLFVASFVHAETVSTWILARSLHVRLPADPSPGGVAWSQRALGLPTSWSAESKTLRVEIAEQPSTKGEEDAKAEMAKALPGMGSIEKLQVSSYPAYHATSGSNHVLAIQTPRNTWVVLTKGDDAAGVSVLRSIVMERAEAQNWQRRFWQGVGLRTFLPYHLAPDASARDAVEGKDYELHFDGFSLRASVQKAGEGKTLDLKGTVDTDIKALKADKRYEDLKFKRIRIKEVKDAEIVTYDYKEKGTPKLQYFLVGRSLDGDGLLIRWTCDANNMAHLDYSNRIIFSLEQVKFDNRGQIQTWKADKYGFSLEVAKPLQQTKSGDSMEEWSSDLGAMVVTARVASNSGNVAPKGVTDLLDGVFKGTTGGSDYSSKVEPFVVSGLDGLVLKSKMKMSGRWAYRYGLVVQTIQRTYVVDVLAMDEDAAERIIESARIDLNFSNDALTRHSFKNSIFSVNKMKQTTVQDFPEDPTFQATQNLQLLEAGRSNLVQIAQRAKQGVISPRGTAKTFMEEVAKGVKSKATILSEGWGMDGDSMSYWIVYTIEIGGKKYRNICHVVAKGADGLIQNLMYVSEDSATMGVNQILMNSYRG